MKPITIKLASLILILAYLASCGGGGASGGGGIGGTGISTVSGFGSVIINDDRVFEVNQDTKFTVDDRSVSELEFEQVGTGMVVRIDVADDVSADFSSGTAVNIVATNNVKGPITSTQPLRVLGQDIIITANTILADVPADDVANLGLGDVVEVSGYAGDNNVIQATRFQYKSAGLTEWKLLGKVSAVGGGTFTIGNQVVDPAAVAPRDCGAGITVGQLVEVKATPDMDLTTLDTVIDVECKPAGLVVPGGISGTVLEAEVEGLINEVVTAGSEYIINGQRVLINGSTVFENGTLEDMVLGARMEAEGQFDTASGILTADKIEFREVRVRIESLVDSVNPGTGQLTMMDVINLQVTELTEFDGGLTSLADINVGVDQIEVRGFVDSANTVYVTRIRDRSASPDVRLRGPVASGCNVNIADFEIDILGVTIDVNDIGTVIRDQAGNPLSINGFCSAATVGTPVNVEDGTFSTPPPRIDNANLIEIED